MEFSPPPSSVSWTAIVLLVADWVLRLGLSVRIVMRPRGVGVTLSWLLIVLLVPLVGSGVYLTLGENRLGRSRMRRAAALRGPYDAWVHNLDAPKPEDWCGQSEMCAPIARQARQLIGVPTLAGNRLELLSSSEEALRRIISDIDAAVHHCHFEFYIWFEGGTADEVVEALERAAARGVDCRVLLDAVGSKQFLRSALARRMREGGVAVVESLPAGFIRAIFRRIDLRNHRKIIVIDHEIAYTGSLNMADPRLFKRSAGVGQWVDAMVRMRGPAVQAMQATFLEYWHVETGEDLLHLQDYAPAEEEVVEQSPRRAPGGTSLVQVAPSGPHMPAESIHRLLLTAIYSARESLVLTTPYFVPDESLLIALTSAATRGVDTLIIVPENSDSFLARHASYAYYGELAAAGVSIARYYGGLLHTKSVTVDEGFSIFGTVNLDMRSFYLNFELSLLIYDADFTRRLRTLQHSYVIGSNMFRMDEWEKRRFGARLVDSTCRLLGPLL